MSNDNDDGVYHDPKLLISIDDELEEDEPRCMKCGDKPCSWLRIEDHIVVYATTLADDVIMVDGKDKVVQYAPKNEKQKKLYRECIMILFGPLGKKYDTILDHAYRMEYD